MLIFFNKINLSTESLRYSIEFNANRQQTILNNTNFDKIRHDSRFINLLNAELPQHPKDSKPSV
ncbi:MAG: hypothetical protein VKL42_21870 [Snowella sp.]|nr:hypothetical protein [Snowella sp.]